MSAVQGLMMGYEGPLIKCDAADFDGTNDYMLRGGDLTGSADGKKGLLSAWIRLDGGDGVAKAILGNGGGSSFLGLQILRLSTNKFSIICRNSGLTQILNLASVSTYVASVAWIHVLASWDLATPGACHLYINDIENLDLATFTDDTIDYTQTQWSVGALPNGGSKIDACFAEMVFYQGTYLDFSIVANRRKFISPSRRPMPLGATGSLPTGTAPIIYQHLDDGEAVANFATNRGTGGDFTITGTLDTASTSPSD